MSLELLLLEWAKWAHQGNSWGIGYPSEACTESLAIPFKRCPTTQESLDEIEASSPANERIGEMVERWVSQLHEPMRTVVRVQYVEMPEHNRGDMNRTSEQWQQIRARRAASLLREREPRMKWAGTVDQYESAYELAMLRLGDFEVLWARGV